MVFLLHHTDHVKINAQNSLGQTTLVRASGEGHVQVVSTSFSILLHGTLTLR